MSKVLSQQEIDALLSALSSGEIVAEDMKVVEEEPKVKPYDFRRPNKFSKEQLSSLEIIYENYSRIVSNYLSYQVRSNIKMKEVSIEQVTYEEFTKSIPNPTLLLNFKMPPLGGVLLLEINPQFAFQIIELLCGGKVRKQVPVRELTDIEKSIIKEMLNNFIMSMKEAWQDVIEVHPVLESLETNPQLNQTMAPTEPVALITFVIEVAEVQSFVNLCIPYLSIEKIVDKLEVEYWFQNDSSDENSEYTSIIEEKIMSTKVDVSVILGNTHITVEDFMSLSVGDVLMLDKLTNDALDMYVEDQMYFMVQPGIYKGKLAVQVVDFVEKDVHIND
ncbi:MAG TPA: flagellar motor switch protein FliM [Clostridiales bacterium]|nr:flagellar motor switch protein FliM [Clostridiales bacterium]